MARDAPDDKRSDLQNCAELDFAYPTARKSSCNKDPQLLLRKPWEPIETANRPFYLGHHGWQRLNENGRVCGRIEHRSFSHVKGSPQLPAVTTLLILKRSIPRRQLLPVAAARRCSSPLLPMGGRSMIASFEFRYCTRWRYETTKARRPTKSLAIGSRVLFARSVGHWSWEDCLPCARLPQQQRARCTHRRCWPLIPRPWCEPALPTCRRRSK